MNFLQYQSFPARHMGQRINILELFSYFQAHPEALAAVSFSILVFSLFGLLATNWSRIMLVLVVENILKRKLGNVREQMTKSKYSLVPVIKISLGTTFLIVVTAVGLFMPPLFFTHNVQFQSFLWVIAAVIFLPIIFAVSCINIFTTYFVILFKQKLPHALNLGTDFFASRWTEILGLTVVLMAIYTVCFFVGVSLIFSLKVAFAFIFEQLQLFTILPVSAIIVIPNVFSSVLLWILLSLLNVFINTALLLLFLQLVTPIETDEKVLQSSPDVSPAPAG